MHIEPFLKLGFLTFSAALPKYITSLCTGVISIAVGCKCMLVCTYYRVI